MRPGGRIMPATTGRTKPSGILRIAGGRNPSRSRLSAGARWESLIARYVVFPSCLAKDARQGWGNPSVGMIYSHPFDSLRSLRAGSVAPKAGTTRVGRPERYYEKALLPAGGGDSQLAQFFTGLERLVTTWIALDHVPQFCDAVVFLAELDQGQSLLQV
jgi:hypothetical protein